jgi:hypothetical protein
MTAFGAVQPFAVGAAMTQRVDLPRYFTDISTAGFNPTSPAAGAIGYGRRQCDRR